jgi:hypothetical protein
MMQEEIKAQKARVWLVEGVKSILAMRPAKPVCAMIPIMPP